MTAPTRAAKVQHLMCARANLVNDTSRRNAIRQTARAAHPLGAVGQQRRRLSREVCRRSFRSSEVRPGQARLASSSGLRRLCRPPSAMLHLGPMIMPAETGKTNHKSKLRMSCCSTSSASRTWTPTEAFEDRLANPTLRNTVTDKAMPTSKNPALSKRQRTRVTRQTMSGC